MDAIEIAIIHNAEQHSIWWQENCARVCFNPEGSLRYFGLLACINSPSSNLDIITQLLSDKLLLESTVSYEMGNLIQKAFVQLDPAVQDTIQTTIHSLYQKNMEVSDHREYMIRKQSILLICIPCHLRSPTTISILDECNKFVWPLEHKVAIKRWAGTVRAPFLLEVFHKINNENVLCLLTHYNGYGRNSFSDELIGGEDDVAQLPLYYKAVHM